MRVFRRLRNGTKITDAMCVRCYLYFWKGAATKIPRKSCRRNIFPKLDSVTSIRWAQPRITLSLRKKLIPRGRSQFYISRLIAIIWTRPEPEPEPYIRHQTQAGPVLTSSVQILLTGQLKEEVVFPYFASTVYIGQIWYKYMLPISLHRILICFI